MKLFRSLDSIPQIEGTVVSLGNFDGVHIGHQELIRRTVKSARIASLKSAVFTFSNHPKNVLSGENTVKNILPLEDKIRIIKSLGIEILFLIDFDEYIHHLGAEEFITELLVGKFNMKEAYCGFNYRFGYQATGNPELMTRIGFREGFGIHVLEPVLVDGVIVSSTLIRERIEAGHLEDCKKYMGRNYSIGGQVISGRQIGRTIGFPTTNIHVDETMVIPPNGVYATKCQVDGVWHQSITNVGIKPTVGAKQKNVETHIFDFNQSIYGQQIQVEFLTKIREERLFPDTEALARQIQVDVGVARDYHLTVR